jgi:hypothetical protein
MSKPRRPWFRFSLRMLFVVLTIFACWLGWNLNIVRQREQLLASLKDDGWAMLVKGPKKVSVNANGRRHFVRMPIESGTLPMSWRLLGAKPIGMTINLLNRTPDDEVQRVKSLFPETQVYVMENDPIPDLPVRRNRE